MNDQQRPAAPAQIQPQQQSAELSIDDVYRMVGAKEVALQRTIADASGIIKDLNSQIQDLNNKVESLSSELAKLKGS